MLRKYTCNVEDCTDLTDGGMCTKHRYRMRKWGRTELPSHFEKFMMLVEKTDTCWLWKGYIRTDGYGRARHTSSNHGLAHKWLWEHTNGSVPEGLELDHLCRVRHCVNPEHLEPVTRQVNVLRGVSPPALNARKTHCPQGHALAGDNLGIGTHGGRFCRICSRVRAKAHKAKLHLQSRARKDSLVG